jgi:hypothetical protein
VSATSPKSKLANVHNLDSPTETQLQSKPGADIARLVAVAKMSHKYSLTSFETWALDIIWTHCQPGPGMDYLKGCSQDMLYRIFEVAEAGAIRIYVHLLSKGG